MAEVFVGKTGADAIFKAVTRICIVTRKYNAKLLTLITLAETAGIITPVEATTAQAFVAAATATCNIWEKLSGASGFPGE